MTTNRFTRSTAGLLVLAAAFPAPAQPTPPTPATAAAPTPPAGPFPQAPGSPVKGFYRQPTLRGNLIIFVAEGDLWKVPATGGVATRLTSHPGDESDPALSPDGSMVAFAATYEGPNEIYTMPTAGGLPTRHTFDASRTWVSSWTPDGKLLAMTERFSTLPNPQLTLLDPETSQRTLLPLAQAADGCYDAEGTTLYFTRLAFQGSRTKRYKGGTAQQLWRFSKGDAEATPLTKDYPGTSKDPMWWKGRVYFATDRDGHMNIWSMLPDGTDTRPHTTHHGLDIQSPDLDNGRIVYQLGPDLWLLDLESGQTKALEITLDTDLDQMRERWVDKPAEFITSWSVSPKGDRLLVTARGRVFVFPHRQGRIVDAHRDDTIRYRNAAFAPDGLSIFALSDKTGEIEAWKLPANGVGQPEQITTGADVLRWEVVPSPDGSLLAHHDKNQRLWITNLATKATTKIDESTIGDFDDLRWSPDSQWLAYVAQAANAFRTIRLYSLATGQTTTVTTDRFDSYSPAWHPGGEWLYFLTDRNLRTLVPSPWGPNQPDPFLTDTTDLYALALKPGLRFPFLPKDELADAKEKPDDTPPKEEKKEPAAGAAPSPAADATPDDTPAKKDAPKPVEVVLDGIMARLHRVPVPSGNYTGLSANDKNLFFLSTPTGFNAKTNLVGLAIANENIEIKQIVADVRGYQIAADGKKLALRKGDSFYIIDATAGAATDLDKKAVVTAGWSLSLVPRQQWRQMFIDSWRLMRDYFYDPGMHGVNWRAMLDKYMPMVDRVTTRAELSDVIAQMVGELSALHIFVRGGDTRSGPDNVPVGALGAELVRDEAAGGFRVARLYEAEPDDPDRASPLAKPHVAVRKGDVIESVDGIAALTVRDLGQLLRNKADRQVLLRVRPAKGDGTFDASRDVVVVPISQSSEADLRYHDWQYSRRRMVDRLGEGRIGYVHLRAMGGENYTEWVKGFYPVYTREALIIDVRHNRGGNIDSWILGKLMRKAWFYWNARVGQPPSWNMQYAFRGPMVILVNERTASDGEAIAEGFRRLGLGKIIGTRTWGGEIWLSSSNVLVDRGIASAAEFGVWGPEGQWLIEGHGVDPDIVVDNMPHATFLGEDSQIKAAVEHLKARLAEQPVPPVQRPPFPDKSFENR